MQSPLGLEELRGNREVETITTPFGMVVLHDLDGFHVAIDTVVRLPQSADRSAYL